MSKPLFSMFFVLMIAIACAASQTGNVAGSGNSQSGTHPFQRAQSSQAGASTQPGTTGSNQPNSPSTNLPGGATDASGGGIAGAAGSTAGKTQIPEATETPSAPAAPSDSDLQAQLQNALSKEPTLSGDTVKVAVSADSIDITGSVATAREKQTATRIVQSYAGNKKVVSHLTVTGRNRKAAPGGGSSETNPRSQRSWN